MANGVSSWIYRRPTREGEREIMSPILNDYQRCFTLSPFAIQNLGLKFQLFIYILFFKFNRLVGCFIPMVIPRAEMVIESMIGLESRQVTPTLFLLPTLQHFWESRNRFGYEAISDKNVFGNHYDNF